MSKSSFSQTGEDIGEDTVYYRAIRPPSFEGASNSYRLQHRDAIISDADTLALGELVFLQSRCRHVIRNNPIASAASDKHVRTMGSITVKWTKPDGTTHTAMQKLWDIFAENPMQDGKGDFSSFQAVQNRDRFASGESLARMLIVKDSAPIPLKLQGIESEYLDINYMGDNTEGSYPLGRTRYGITFDANTRNIPELYNFWGDRHYGMNPEFTPYRVPVPAKNIIHTFERVRSNQWRGVPLLAASLISLYEIEDLCTATVRAQTSASAITWVVSEINNAAKDPTGVVSLLGKNAPHDANKKIVFDTSGGTTQYTHGKFNLVQSRDIGSNLVTLIKDGYQKIASALDMPYYMMSGDTSGLDFSSIRGVLTSFRQSIEFLYTTTIIPDMIRPIVNRFKDIAVVLGHDVLDAVPVYQFPRWYGVDDLKDAQADLLEVISGLAPIQAKWTERNYTKEQIEQSIALLKELGLEALLAKAPNPAQNNSAPTNNTTGS